MRIISFATVLFAAILAVVVGYRIDQATIIVIAGVATGFVVAAIVVGLIAFIFIRQTRQPARTAHQPPTGDWVYYVQHPLPKPTAHQLSAPAEPQYDDTVTFTLKQPQRKWVAVDEVTR